MPFYTFRCDDCSIETQMLLKPEQLGDPRSCAKCGAVVKRIFKPGSVKVIEVIDTGFYARRVEREKK